MRISMLGVLSLCAAGAWVGLALLRGRFWRAPIDEPAGAAPSEEFALREVRVEAIVPARDEAGVVRESLPALVRQRFSGTLRVTLVDDHSDDGTANVARAVAQTESDAARLEIVDARSLREGWTGKLNALQSGVERVLAARGGPDYWLFTDADIVHGPGVVASLVAKARDERLDLVSLMVKLHCATFWERLLIPAFVFFFQKLYPFAWANDPKHRTAAAAGGCILLSNAALERIGGLASISSRLIDDCALAAAVKGSGGGIWIGLSGHSHSLRVYDSLGDIWSMVKRTAFTQLNRSYALLAGTVVAMLLLYAVPPAAAVLGLVARDPLATVCGFGTWLLMSALYLPTIRAYERPAVAATSLPLAAVLYTAMTVDSALASLRKLDGGWKGRTYASPSSP